MGPSLKVFMGFMFCATEKCWARPRLDKVLTVVRAQNTLCTRHDPIIPHFLTWTSCQTRELCETRLCHARTGGDKI